MQIEQRFQLPQPPQAVWQAFEDIGLLVDCLPGASLTADIVDGAVPLRFDVKLGPIKAGFVGNGQLSLYPEKRSGSFEGAAADRGTQSRVKGQASFVVSEQAGGSAVDVTVDYALTGSLAQFSRGAIVRELANALTAQFAANLEARISADLNGQPDPAGAQLSAPAVCDPVAQRAVNRGAAPLNLRGLFWMAFKSWWRRFIHGWRRSKP